MKRVFFLLIAVLTVSYAHAQVSIGVRAGLNLTNLYSDDDYATFKPGFQAGVVADFAFHDNFSLQPGLQFSQMGAQSKEDGDVSRVTLNYIQLPVNFQAKFGDFFVQAGPYLGYGVNVNLSYKSEGIKASTSKSFKDFGVKPLDVGFGGGIGYQFGPIQAALNTQYSLISINDNDSNYTIKNLGLALTATYFFGK